MTLSVGQESAPQLCPFPLTLPLPQTSPWGRALSPDTSVSTVSSLVPLLSFTPLFRGALRVSVLFSAALDPQCIAKLLILLDVGLHFAPSHPQALIEITILSSQLFPAVLKVYIFLYPNC